MHTELGSRRFVSNPTEYAGGACVLVAEDDLDLRLAIRDALKVEGYSVVEASNGREALHALVRHEPPVSLIVSDILMPEMSGPDLVRVIANYIGLSRIPVIIITAAMPGTYRTDRDPAVVGRLQKPFGLSQLLDLVSTTLHAGTPDGVLRRSG